MQCVTSQVKVNHDILTPDSRDNLLKVPFDIEILIYFQIKIPSSKKSLLFLCFVQSTPSETEVSDGDQRSE